MNLTSTKKASMTQMLNPHKILMWALITTVTVMLSFCAK